MNSTNSLDFVSDVTLSGIKRTGLAIGAIVKDEGQYIGEWLKFHEKAGVNNFFIYDDGSTDDTVQIAESSCSTAIVTVFPWSQRLKSQASKIALNNQVLAYGHCLSNFRHLFQWMSFIDVDEFLVPVENNSIPEALEDLTGIPLIVLPWVMFGTSNQIKKSTKATTETYIQRLNPLVSEGVRGVFNVKCIFDPCAITRLHVHRMRVNNSFYGWNDEGKRFMFTSALKPKALTASKIQLNHYYSRSFEDIEEKINKGGGTYTSREKRNRRLLDERIAFIDSNSATDRVVLDFLARVEVKTNV